MGLETSFDFVEMVTAYDSRPLYDNRAISLLFDKERSPGGIIRDGDVIADLGAAQGRFLSSLFSAKSFLDSGISLSKVIAMEPSPLMLAELRAKFRERNNLETRQGTFQDMPIADNSVDVAVCAASLHWGCITEEDAARTASELARILKDDGRLVVLSDSVSQKPGVTKTIHDLKRSPEIIFSSANGFGDHTYSIEPQPGVEAAIYWGYRATAEEIEAEYRSQAYIQALPETQRRIFFNNLREIIDLYSVEGSVNLERACMVQAGSFQPR